MADLKEKLAQANKKAEEQKTERRERTVKGAHLTPKFVELAKDAGCDIRENTGFHVITGKAGKSLRIYVAKRGGIIDLLGFTVQDEAIRQISREEAKAKHMGRVFGRVDLDKTDEAVLAAYSQALTILNTPLPETEKSAKKAKVVKADAIEVVPEIAEMLAGQPSAAVVEGASATK
jgi:hypothetical protein